MARDEIDLLYLAPNANDTICSKKITKQAVTQANGIELKNAFAGKDNSIVISVENTGSASTATVKAGEKQNASLGDQNVTLAASAITAFELGRDAACFERNNGSVYIDFASGFTGNIWVTAVPAGLHGTLSST